MGVYMVLAGIERFAVEFLRAKDDHIFGPLTMAQYLADPVHLRGCARDAHAQRRARLGARHLRRRVSVAGALMAAASWPRCARTRSRAERRARLPGAARRRSRPRATRRHSARSSSSSATATRSCRERRIAR